MVGGVVGIIGIVVVVLLILRNREKQSPSSDPTVGQPEVVQQPPPDSPYDPKQATHFSSYPSSPTPAPPQYQSPTTQSNVFYTQHPQPSNPVDSYGGYVPPSSIPPTSPIPAYGDIPSQPELPYNIVQPHGIVEMNADQNQR